MKIRRTAGKWLYLVVSVLVVSIGLSCSSDKCTNAGDDEGPDRTRENLLVSFAKSYREKDLDAYDECLCEDFRFYFTDEMADSLGLPPEEPWWGKTEDLNSTGNMFASPHVIDVGFAFEYHTAWTACEDVRGDTTYNGLCRRLDPLIEVMTTIDSSGDPWLKYRVDSSWLDIMIVPDPHLEDLWCILRIEEVYKLHLQGPIIGGGTATEPSSWGAVKALFFSGTMR